MILFHFGHQAGNRGWQSIGDPVMGGQSVGVMDELDASTSVFHGTVSLANGGGFASVKTDIPVTDLSHFNAIRLAVRGDGKDYKLGLRISHDRNAPVYQHAFATQAGQQQTIELPFTGFVPRLRGRTLVNAPALDTSRIASVSLFISGGQQGPFALYLSGAASAVPLKSPD
ncbi:hypothetical protein J2T57_000914 [Natronocella acetinitrilica]|uniref:NADH:ubiquinone oxidoreductase intermediate-associated protein 30 domain-containing protein n=1 Tax=Natronocella acetinitrilica TaxID=414046 RepID=A0AAE3G1G0_9GAMM|nr:CIA30 family protein [Natronocella acetinitrilica]MCP1673815.1 hypothetical protein [Natronocella acetinitrilica]